MYLRALRVSPRPLRYSYAAHLKARRDTNYASLIINLILTDSNLLLSWDEISGLLKESTMKKSSSILPALFLALVFQLFFRPAIQAAESANYSKRSIPGKSIFKHSSIIIDDSLYGKRFALLAKNELSWPAYAVRPDLIPWSRQLPIDYLRMSKRHKRTGWVLLGAGLALTAGGVIVASHQDEGIDAGLAFAFISGAGVFLSLISIPFFIASARNKRKAMALSPSVGLQQRPASMPFKQGSQASPMFGVKLTF